MLDEPGGYALGATPFLGMTLRLRDWTCDTLLIVGSSYPYIEFYPQPGQAKAVQVDIDPQRIGLRYDIDAALVGDSRRVLQMLLPHCTYREDRSFIEEAQKGMRAWRELMHERGTRQDTPMKPQVVAHELNNPLAYGDERWAVGFALGSFQCSVKRRQVGPVLDVLHVPVVRLEPRLDILREREVGTAVDRYFVVVVEKDELAETEVPGERCRLVADAFHQVAVRADAVGVMVDHLESRPVELSAEELLGHGETHRIREALAERAGRGLDPGGVAVFGMAGGPRVELAEGVDVRSVVHAGGRHGPRRGPGGPGRPPLRGLGHRTGRPRGQPRRDIPPLHDEPPHRRRRVGRSLGRRTDLRAAATASRSCSRADSTAALTSSGMSVTFVLSPSLRIWNSICRGSTMYFSMNTRPSPKAACASRWAAATSFLPRHCETTISAPTASSSTIASMEKIVPVTAAATKMAGAVISVSHESARACCRSRCPVIAGWGSTSRSCQPRVLDVVSPMCVSPSIR